MDQLALFTDEAREVEAPPTLREVARRAIAEWRAQPPQSNEDAAIARKAFDRAASRLSAAGWPEGFDLTAESLKAEGEIRAELAEQLFGGGKP